MLVIRSLCLSFVAISSKHQDNPGNCSEVSAPITAPGKDTGRVERAETEGEIVSHEFPYSSGSAEERKRKREHSHRIRWVRVEGQGHTLFNYPNPARILCPVN